jgi:hypothetical protein
MPTFADRRESCGERGGSPTVVNLSFVYRSRYFYSAHHIILDIKIRIIKSRKMRWAGHVARMGEKRNVYRLLVGKPEGKRPLVRPRRRWIDNIKMALLEIGLNVVDCIGLAQDRYRWRALVNAVMNLRVP